ncbi:MAG: hypothetical protein JOZ67_02445 [Gammaproteobacteria bacterium]|nr:hypothetical protein [Gammaproteobacteria bacterium]MBV9695572.1 hypothetical protein [Gammaproteobacteria bacterium]
MREVLRLFTQLALLRRGPQDMPASPLLLALAALIYMGLNALLVMLLPLGRPGHAPELAATWPLQLLLNAAFIYLWYAVLLRVAGYPERTLQTTTAVFGLLLVLTPLVALCGWLWSHFADDAVWGAPVTLLGLGVILWLIVANSRIVRVAFEWSVSVSVALVLLQIVAAELLRRALFASTEG